MVQTDFYNHDSNQVTNLAMMREGQKGDVIQILAGRKAVRRLSGLGITPGTEIEKMTQAPFRGPIQIRVRGSRLALGQGLARKIIINPN